MLLTKEHKEVFERIRIGANGIQDETIKRLVMEFVGLIDELEAKAKTLRKETLQAAAGVAIDKMYIVPKGKGQFVHNKACDEIATAILEKIDDIV